ncbi:S-layer homology domain-containing protein [Paenibacillus sp. 1781tsa1]|uniref:S-layer homology domain-containing protein n=1 Tax=Paenibacillus sp. 1781tsa1 TaxID=2953810 RepID=UPI0020A2255D|nr:S-layer homology domain-containing protein [Paenibacillus sp. 1781tsa1]MCP1187396.1 S-layer homology domain-containing protein [Paenibacillus sp. 1781tsa1]
MNYKKLISCLLIAVLLLQVVSVGGVASADPFTPLDQLNMEREMYIESDEGTTVTHVQNLLEQQDLITLPEDYEALDDNQKYEIARGMVMLLPLEFSYENNNQANYVFDLVYHLISLPKQTESSTLQYSINLVYSLLAEWSTYFPNVGKPDWTQAGNDYMSLMGADLSMFTSNLMFFNIIFMNSSDPTHFNSQLEFMVTKISEYKELNGALDLSSMEASLDNLYGMYDFIQMHVIFNPNPNIQPFVFDMGKMSTIQNDTTKKSELAQWMIDHKPQNGYETVSQVQKEFDAFFNKDTTLTKYNELKKEADRGNSNDFIQDIIVLLRDEQFITEPDFKMLSVKDQEDIAIYLLDIDPPTNEGYENNKQVQFMVQVALKALEVTRKIDGPNAITALDEFYNKQAERVNHFKEPDPEGEYYRLINTYLTSSEMDKWMTKYRYAIRLKGKESISRVVKFTDTAVERTPYLNHALTEAEVLSSLEHFRSIQKDVEKYNSDYPESPLDVFPLDFAEMDNLTNEYKQQLAEHMLSERPLGGYASFEEIQTAFNKFFPDDNEDPLTVLNTAKTNGDVAAVRTAMENPDLGITLPNGYGALSLQERDFIAGFLIEYVNKDYKNKEQVQYMMELAVLAQSVWEQKQLVTLKNKLDELSQKLADLPVSFNDQQNEGFRSIGKEYLKRTNKVDQSVFAYRYLYSIAFERLEGNFQGNIVEPMVLLGLLTTPYQSIDKATKVDRMDQWLDSAMNDYITGEAFFNKYKFDRTGALDLSKRAELSPEDQKELAEWMLTEQDSYETVENLQYVFDRFFTAPAVKGNDITNIITGLDSTMEISFDDKQHWLDLANIQKLDFSGNKTVWVRYKAISDELPGRAVKIVFTQNGDSNTDNGSTPNPGGSNGGGSTSTPVTSTPVPTTKQEQIVVDVNGTNGTNLTKTPITRTTETNGTIKDLVKMTEAIAKESVEKAKQLNMNTARIVIPDTKDSVSETRIEVPKAAVKELNDGSLKLEISTENVVISVPTNSIAGFDQDLYFRVVPLKKESERKEVEERAKKEQLIQQVAPNANVRVLARPVEIDTNMQSREVTLTLPLRDSLPTDPAARQQALDNLAIYIEHSDGTKELIQGKLVQLTNSEGIEFTVAKFSTFTLVIVDGLKASQSTHQPYIQGFDADFRPDAFVTRSQMAAMLARNLPNEAAAGSTNSVSYKDVSATHWATSEIQKAQSAGIMNGMSNTQFAPEGSITRAQMATIAYRWMQNQQANTATMTGTAVSFTDVSADLWAAEAIAYVQSAGLMVGYNDGTFKPESKLTRAEAVKVLNVMFNRTPLTGAVTPTFSDVPATHWAYADIEAAAQK